MVLTLKVKVKAMVVKIQNLLISIPGKDETCQKIWATSQQNYGFDLEGQGQGQGGQGPKFNHFYSRLRQNLSEVLNDIGAKLWLLEQNCDFDLEGQGQGQGGKGPKFNPFYSRLRRNLSEILNGIQAKLWAVGC